jgi:magnesium-transporting ATPase (P-type)
MMSILLKGKDGNFLLTKGAPEKIIEKSKFLLNSFGEKIELSEHIKKRLLKESNSFGNEGFRVVAIAYKESHLLGTLGSV